MTVVSVDDLAWWRSWRDRQVHAFIVSGLDPQRPPGELTAICGHKAPTDVVEPRSSGMPCVLCIARAPVTEQP